MASLTGELLADPGTLVAEVIHYNDVNNGDDGDVSLELLWNCLQIQESLLLRMVDDVDDDDYDDDIDGDDDGVTGELLADPGTLVAEVSLVHYMIMVM